MPSPAPARRFQQFPDLIARWVPDAVTASVILTLTLVVVALFLGNPITRVLDAYHQGLWMLLQFTMQMTLIIVLSAALAITPVFRKAVAALARLPRSPRQVVILAFLSAGAASYTYWGLGYALGPTIAIFFAAEAERRGLAVDFPYLIGVTYGAQALWQYGPSSSGPLLMASPGHFLQNVTGVLPLSTTIWSPAAIVHEIAYATVAILVACLLIPKRCRWLSHYPEAQALSHGQHLPGPDHAKSHSFAQRLESSPIVVGALAVILAGWLIDHFVVKRLGYELNSLNTFLLLLTFVLYGSVKRFAKAIEQSIGRSWAVIILYHLYAGVAGMVQFTNVGEKVTRIAAAISSPATFPLITAVAGSVFACFIPSSGGQWTVQGLVTVKTAMAVGVTAQRGMLALGVGDHMGNFLTPFWYVVVAGIARVDFRSFFGYGFLYAAIWFIVGVITFTFAPC